MSFPAGDDLQHVSPFAFLFVFFYHGAKPLSHARPGAAAVDKTVAAELSRVPVFHEAWRPSQRAREMRPIFEQGHGVHAVPYASWHDSGFTQGVGHVLKMPVDQVLRDLGNARDLGGGWRPAQLLRASAQPGEDLFFGHGTSR